MHKFTNKLIESTSPYLLQHAHNPVNWHPWGDEAILMAKKENKPLLISIGYSACHWCHVMERECFEDEETAALMNEYFICIKVDREERPDIDQLYMLAVQLMSNRGGWPLNCFALPDGRPIYGGTYFPKANWQQILNQIHQLFTKDYKQVEEYAENLTKGIQQSELFKAKKGEQSVSIEDLRESVNKWMGISDHEEGGPNRAPKFPLPNNYQFLLRYGHLINQNHVLAYAHLTLKKMAFGGIYDQIGGGFARYSTDPYWKVPHFEKMLYDNGQLMSLYAEAYLHRADEDYKRVCFQTAEFISRELTGNEGYFFSALDADSEGEEGKFYVWQLSELEACLNENELKIAKEYYSINTFGLWEKENFILLRRDENTLVAERLEISDEDLKKAIYKIESKLLLEREKRIRPGLDDKMLCSWNSMMIKGLADSSRVFEHKGMHIQAIKATEFILHNLKNDQGKLYHSWKNGKATISGFLEDYAFFIDALISLYESDYNERWLLEARELTFTVLDDFEKSESGLFYFTSNQSEVWVARQLETSDNVQPASNSVMARNLNKLGIYFGKEEWIMQSKKMLKTVREELINYGPGYSNWAMLVLEQTEEFKELVITGAGAIEKAKELRKIYKPDVLIAATEKDSKIPLFEGRTASKDLTFYLCRGNQCEAPVKNFKWEI
ncbi:MAG: thioredoxin domain-containing protein [Bacteroidia bacterium]